MSAVLEHSRSQDLVEAYWDSLEPLLVVNDRPTAHSSHREPGTLQSIPAERIA